MLKGSQQFSQNAQRHVELKKQEVKACVEDGGDMPKCLDWRNKNSINYESPVRKQGDCGSCYAVIYIFLPKFYKKIVTRQFFYRMHISLHIDGRAVLDGG